MWKASNFFYTRIKLAAALGVELNMIDFFLCLIYNSLTDMKTLKELRLENELSIIDLASKAGVSFGTIVRIERGLPAKSVTKRKIAKALHKRPSDIDFNLSYKLP